MSISKWTRIVFASAVLAAPMLVGCGEQGGGAAPAPAPATGGAPAAPDAPKDAPK